MYTASARCRFARRDVFYSNTMRARVMYTSWLIIMPAFGFVASRSERVHSVLVFKGASVKYATVLIYGHCGKISSWHRESPFEIFIHVNLLWVFLTMNSYVEKDVIRLNMEWVWRTEAPSLFLYHLPILTHTHTHTHTHTLHLRSLHHTYLSIPYISPSPHPS